MIGTRSATTALILVASLAPVALAQQQPAKPAAAPQPPAATPQPQKPAAAPAQKKSVLKGNLADRAKLKESVERGKTSLIMSIA